MAQNAKAADARNETVFTEERDNGLLGESIANAALVYADAFRRLRILEGNQHGLLMGVRDMQARIAALEAAPAQVPPPNVVQLTREQFDQPRQFDIPFHLVESLQAIYEISVCMGRDNVEAVHIRNIAAEALERLGLDPEAQS